LKDFAVPIAAAIIGATAALWNSFQSKWNGRHFQKLMLRELEELQPTKNEDTKIGDLASYVRRKFMHKEVLQNPLENRDFIMSLDPNLVYLTNQLWSLFDRNDIHFLKYLYDISIGKKSISKWPYDRKGKIGRACDEWIIIVGKENVVGKKIPIQYESRKRWRDKFICNIRKHPGRYPRFCQSRFFS
jgi:hypothetical protein